MRYTTAEEDRRFIEHIMPSGLLESAAAWIAEEFSPEDVFDSKQLETWAEENGYIKDTDV